MASGVRTDDAGGFGLRASRCDADQIAQAALGLPHHRWRQVLEAQRVDELGRCLRHARRLTGDLGRYDFGVSLRGSMNGLGTTVAVRIPVWLCTGNFVPTSVWRIGTSA
jgi:hypothetical protein